MAELPVTYQCLFCGAGVAPGEHDPCAIVVVAGIDRPRAGQKEQTFYCHLGCLRARASVHPGAFYIADTDFPTVGELEADGTTSSEPPTRSPSRPPADVAAAQVAALPWGDVTLRGIRWRAEDAGMDLLIERPGEGETCLRCSWVSGFRTTLSFAGGPPLSWDADFERLSDGRWRLRFDFAARGEFVVTCDEIELIRAVHAPNHRIRIGV